MAFRSDAHRRWWLANRDSGGSTSLSSGGGSAGGAGGSALPIDVDAGQAKRDARIAYAQAMYPHLSAPDALRQLNDRNG